MKELEAKRDDVIKQASSLLRRAADELRAFASTQNAGSEKAASAASEPVREPDPSNPEDLEALKQAFLRQIAEDEAELARLAEGK